MQFWISANITQVKKTWAQSRFRDSWLLYCRSGGIKKGIKQYGERKSRESRENLERKIEERKNELPEVEWYVLLRSRPCEILLTATNEPPLSSIFFPPFSSLYYYLNNHCIILIIVTNLESSTFPENRTVINRKQSKNANRIEGRKEEHRNGNEVGARNG